MPRSSQMLLRQVIDYAGLFPPAQLPLAQALEHFGRFRLSADRDLLGRLILPATHLNELSSGLAGMTGHDTPIRLSVLTRPGGNTQEFLANLETDLQAMEALHQQHGEQVIVDLLETRLPTDAIGAAQIAETMRLLVETAALVEEKGPARVRVFYEVPRTPREASWQDDVQAVILALARNAHGAAAEARLHYLPPGLKLRCGGPTADLFPTTAQVASLLQSARRSLVPLKFTAGLHHPLPHRDEQLGVTQLGFLNLFVAGVLGEYHDPETDLIQTLLEDTNPASFVFTEETMSWRDLSATLEEIEETREEVVTSFGSCSLDEPCAGLRALQLL